MSNKSYYDKYWDTDTAQSASGHAHQTPAWPIAELDMFYDAIKDFIGNSILDIGSGEGIFIEFLLKKSRNIQKIIGLEISETAIEKAKDRNESVNFIEASADDTYPLSANEFDTLFMTDVIEHLVDIDKTISECRRVLRPGGKLIIITPVFPWSKRILIAAFFWNRFFHPTNPHIRFFTKTMMDEIMEKHNFKRLYYRWGLTWFRLLPQNAYFVYEKRG